VKIHQKKTKLGQRVAAFGYGGGEEEEKGRDYQVGGH